MRRLRFNFWAKVGVAAGFAALADALVYHAPGPGVGVAILAGLVSLAELEQRPLPPDLCKQVHAAREQVRGRMAARQSDWQNWRWRDARRLQRDTELGGDCLRRISPAPLTPPAKP